MKWLVLTFAIVAIAGWALLAVLFGKLGGTASGIFFAAPQNKAIQTVQNPTYIQSPQNSTFTPNVFRGPSAAPQIIGPSGPPPNY